MPCSPRSASASPPQTPRVRTLWRWRFSPPLRRSLPSRSCRCGRRGGLAGIADALHRRLARVVGRGLHGERRAVVEGVVLGEDQGLSDNLRQSFRASGLYHLLAVSGQNVVLVAGGALLLVWLVGLPRVTGHLAA